MKSVADITQSFTICPDFKDHSTYTVHLWVLLGCWLFCCGVQDLNDICSAAVLTCFILASVSAVTARQSPGECGFMSFCSRQLLLDIDGGYHYHYWS